MADKKKTRAELAAELDELRNRLAEMKIGNALDILSIIWDSADGILVLDTEGVVLFANPATEAILKRSNDEIIGTDFGILVENQDPIEVDLLTPDGRPVPVELWARNTTWMGKPAYRVSLRDLTERRLAEEAVRQSEAALIEAQATAKVGSWRYDLIPDKPIWSREMFRIFDRDPERGEPSWPEHREYIDARDWPRLDRLVNLALTEGRSYREEFRIVRADGGLYWAEVIGRAEQDHNGRLISLAGTVQDIDQRKRAELALSESEKKYRQLYHSIRDAILVVDTERRVTDCNDRFTETFGYTLEEINGQRTEFIYASQEDFDRMGERIQASLDSDTFIITTNFKKKNGRVFPGQTSVYYLTDGEGNTEGFIGIIRDVTNRVAAEKALEESRRLLNRTEGLAQTGGWELEPGTGSLKWTEGLFRLHEVEAGFEPDMEKELDFFAPEALPLFSEAMGRAIASGEPFDLELPFITAKGRRLWVRVVGETEMEEGRVNKVFGTFQDITRSKQYQRDLVEERDRSQKYLDTAGVVLLALDKQGRVEMINRKGCQVLGLKAEELVGRNWFDEFVPPSWRADLKGIFKEIWAGRLREHLYEEGPVINAAGEERQLRWFNTLMTDSAGEAIGTLSSGEDITEYKKAQEAVNRLAAIVEYSQDAIIGKDLDGLITSWNQAAERIYGYSAAEAVGRHISLIVPEEKHAELASLLEEVRQGRAGRIMETVRRCKNGDLVDVSLSVSPVRNSKGRVDGAATIAHVITDLKTARQEKEKLETQLRQTQKMEAIGTLAGGIAHDFNNILAAIIGYGDLALEDLPPDSKVAEYLKIIMDSGHRARDLTAQILSFSRQSKRQRVPMDLEPLIKEILKMLRSTLPAFIEIKQSIPAGTGEVLADPTQIHQIIMNLCTNAAQAMEEKGGVLEVTLEKAVIDQEASEGFADLAPGSYQCLTVSDTGIGMSKEVMDRMFDPFFTTKPMGKGTGMGLSVVHGIITEYGGAITVSSEPGSGSTINVYLPLSEEASLAVKSPVLSESPRGSERIMFVDDEDYLVDVSRQVLERLGYQVAGFTSPVQAWEAFQAEPDKYDLIITDYTMPRLTGAQMAEKMLALRPEILIIMCTGFSERLNAATARDLGVAHFTLKPLMPNELAAIVRQVLDG